jgi:anti-sigma B factor antagonist
VDQPWIAGQSGEHLLDGRSPGAHLVGIDRPGSERAIGSGGHGAMVRDGTDVITGGWPTPGDAPVSAGPVPSSSGPPVPAGSLRSVLFDVGVSERDGWTVLAVVGELDVATAPRLRQEVHRVAGDLQPAIVLDLSGVDFLDSTGLGVIIGILKRVRTQGGDLRLAGAPDRVRRVFEITRLDDILPMHADVDAAIEGARGG